MSTFYTWLQFKLITTNNNCFSNPECSFPLFQWNDVQIFISQNRSQFSFFQFIRFEKSCKWLLSSRTYSISFCLFFRLFNWVFSICSFPIHYFCFFLSLSVHSYVFLVVFLHSITMSYHLRSWQILNLY